MHSLEKHIASNIRLMFLRRNAMLGHCRWICKPNLLSCDNSKHRCYSGPHIMTTKHTRLKRNSFDLIPRESSRSPSDQPSTFSLSQRDFHSKYSKRNSESLDQLLSGLSYSIDSKQRVYKKDLERIIVRIGENKYISNQQALLLISCCSDLLPDQKPAEKTALVHQLWDVLRTCAQLNVSHYNELLRCHNNNEHEVQPDVFVANMAPAKPNNLTHQLLLENACMIGNMEQAAEILANIKPTKVAGNEAVYNALIEGHAKAGNLKAVDKIVEMMKKIQGGLSSSTHTSLIKASIWNDTGGSVERLFEFSDECEIEFTEKEIATVVKCLVEKNLTSAVPAAISHFPKNSLSSHISQYLYSFCAKLIYDGHAKVSYNIYALFPSKNSTSDVASSGRYLLRENVKALTPIPIIKEIAADFVRTERNPLAFHVVCEAALQTEQMQLAKEMLVAIKGEGFPVRCHYFWPLFIAKYKENGESGIFDIVSFMVSLDVELNLETMEEYVLPCVNMEFLEDLVRKFQSLGVTASTALTPILVYLIKRNDFIAACEISDKIVAKLDCASMIRPLILAYSSSENVSSILQLLILFDKRPKNPQKDWLGLYIIGLLSHQKITIDSVKMNSFLEDIFEAGLRMSSQAGDMCIKHIKSTERKKMIELSLTRSITNLVDKTKTAVLYDGQVTQSTSINASQLKAHLIELESKEMKTRGVLRKLLQFHCSQGNVQEAKVVLQKCEDENVTFSPGMKSSVFDLYLKCNNLEKAEKYLDDLKRTSPQFLIDEHKSMDYATLLVKEKQLSKAIDILEERALVGTIKGGRFLEGNCWRLLNELSNYGKPKESTRMFAFLIRNGYCIDSNILLGPVIQSYLTANDLDGAVQEFIRCAKKYKKTPYKHKLLCQLLLAVSKDLSSKEPRKNQKELQRLLSNVQFFDRKVHGFINSKVSYISALADCGLEADLRSYIATSWSGSCFRSLMTCCNRFAEESRVPPLITLAVCFRDVQDFDLNSIYNLIMRVHFGNNDCDGALSLWDIVVKSNTTPSKFLVEKLHSLLTSQNMEVPEDLLRHIEGGPSTPTS